MEFNLCSATLLLIFVSYAYGDHDFHGVPAPPKSHGPPPPHHEPHHGPPPHEIHHAPNVALKPIPQSVCTLKADPGFCNLIIGRWYYDYRYHRCLPFLYTGCGGNTNNFNSPSACDKATHKCHSPLPPAHDPHHAPHPHDPHLAPPHPHDPHHASHPPHDDIHLHGKSHAHLPITHVAHIPSTVIITG